MESIMHNWEMSNIFGAAGVLSENWLEPRTLIYDIPMYQSKKHNNSWNKKHNSVAIINVSFQPLSIQMNMVCGDIFENLL